MKKSDLIEVLNEISNIAWSARRFVNNPDEFDGGHYVIDPDDFRDAITRRIHELKSDEWAGQ